MPSTPPPTSDTDLVRGRLRARARRVAVIRRRVVAAALSTFVLAFGVIAATGSLGSTTPSTQQAAVTRSSGSSSSTGTTTNQDSATSSSSQSSQPSVTTSQS